MSIRKNLLTGMAIGGGMMFLLDPLSGNRRRALVRDKSVRWSRQTGRALRYTGQTLEATYRGAAAGGRGLVTAARQFTGREDPDVSDRALEKRLRDCIGRHSTHPGAIDVSVQDACATISGHILAREVEEVLECASAVPGVKAVDNRLQVHATPGNLPELQGAGHRRGARRWWEASPALRMATGAAAAGVLAFVASRRAMGSPAG